MSLDTLSAWTFLTTQKKKVSVLCEYSHEHTTCMQSKMIFSLMTTAHSEQTGLFLITLNATWMCTMNILNQASVETGVHKWDILLDAIDNEVDADVMPFLDSHKVMSFIRNGGDELPTDKLPLFVQRHCFKVIAEHRQLALL